MKKYFIFYKVIFIIICILILNINDQKVKAVESYTDEKGLTYTLIDYKSFEITDFDNSSSSVTIPSSYKRERKLQG